MDYFASFDISASGMEVQKARLDTIAANLANANTTRSAGGGPYRPLEVIVGQRLSARFDTLLSGYQRQLLGAEVVDIRPQDSAPRLRYRPEHPDAGAEGYVAYPNIDPVAEMVRLLETTHAYEANVRAANMARSMALRALEIGRR